MEQTWDLLVLGAGPSGALTAREAARRGLEVLLVDKAAFPRWKVCGSCVNEAALSILQSVGLDSLPSRLEAVPLEKFHLSTAGHQAFIPLPGGVALSRTALDQALVQEAQQEGVHFLPETRATLQPAEKEFRSTLLSGPGHSQKVRARVVVEATGLRSTAVTDSARVGLGAVLETAPPFYERSTIYMACGRGSYVGLVRLEDGRLDVAAAVETAQLRSAGNPVRLTQALLKEARFPIPGDLETATWSGTPLLNQSLHWPAAPRLFVVGDAASYVEPFTGEGIAWAMACAVGVIPFVMEGVREWNPMLESDWVHHYRKQIRPRQWLCRGISQTLRRPLLTSWAIGLLSRMPALAAPAVNAVNAQVSCGS